jgi:hypothetical protein
MWPRQFRAVAGNAVKVTMGDPFCLVLHLTGIMLMCLLGVIPGFAAGEHLKLLRDQCLALIFLLGSLGFVFGFICVVTDDIRRGAGSILVSRPIGGFCLVAGKWCGVFATVLLLHGSFLVAYLWTSEIAWDPEYLNLSSLAFYLGAIVLAMGVAGLRHYLFGGSYAVVANVTLLLLVAAVFTVRLLLNGPAEFDWSGIQSGIMLALGLIAFSAFLLPVAMFVDAAIVLCVGVVLFFFGLISNYLTSLGALPAQLQSMIQSLLPNWQIFWVADRLGAGADVPAGYYVSSGIHAVLLLAVALIVGAIVFERMELKAA